MSIKRTFWITILMACGYSSLAQVIITGIIDGTLPEGSPKAIELYVDGTINLANYRIERSSNDKGFSNNFTLTGVYSDEFVYLVRNANIFTSVFGSLGSFANQLTNDNIVSFNGDDAIRIVRISDDRVIDQLLFGCDDTNFYKNSYAYRFSDTGPDGTWEPSNWTIPGNGHLEGLDSCQFRDTVPFGTFVLSPNGAATYSILNKHAAEPITHGSFSVVLTEPAPIGGLIIQYLLSGTAIKGLDYLDILGGTANISEGQLKVDIPIQIIDDTDSDSGETVILNLISVSQGYIPRLTSSTMVILDDEISIIPIYRIQGNGKATPYAGERIITQGIVTSIYTSDGGLGGFFIQDHVGDDDTSTSDGVFVHCAENCPALSIGDLVQVSGTALENSALTQINQTCYINILK